ncbi:DUF2231 domain-containing protein [Nocardia nova]|nr:DUF2231 domain-containing protein [Nocardia nova]
MGVFPLVRREVIAMGALFGLPAHPLLAHVAVVAIPVAAVLAVVVAVFQRVPGLVKLTTLGVGVVAVVVVPLMESSGEALQERVPETAAVERHADLGETLLPWVIGLFVVIVAVLAIDRWPRAPRSSGPGTPRQRDFGLSHRGLRTVQIAGAVAVVVVAAGTLVQTIRIGHSGAQATWSTSAPVQNPGEPEDR